MWKRCESSTTSSPFWSDLSDRRAARRAAVAVLALAGLASSCNGILQRSRPERVATFERIARDGELMVGIAETDITPTDDQYLSGFDMNRIATGVNLPLKARAFVLVKGELRVAIVGIDNLGMHREDVDWVKSGIGGFANGCVFVCASHTHAAPDLIGFWGWYLLTSGRDRGYLTFLRDRVAAAVAEAEAKAQPARLRHGIGRLPPRGIVKNSNFREVFDPRVHVVQAIGADGAPIGALLHLACHPEVMRRQSSVMSADFVGALCDGWRAAGLGDAVFVNGALGGMVTPDGWPRDEAGIARVGGGMLAAAQSALAAARDVSVDAVEVRRRDVYLPLDSMALGLGRLTTTIPRELYGGLLKTGVGWLRIGDLEAVCVPGEIEPAFAEHLRRTLGKPKLMVFGLVDDEVGYLLSERDARSFDFAYERLMSPGATAGELVIEAIVGPRGGS